MLDGGVGPVFGDPWLALSGFRPDITSRDIVTGRADF